MKTFTRFSITAAALAMSLTFAPAAFAQEQAPAPAQEQAQASMLEGELVQVDTEGKMLTVKTADGEQRIAYTDTTTVQGSQEGVAGLTNAGPTNVRITWQAGDDGPVALTITVLPQQ